ncbi:glycosyl transferase family 90 [Salinicola rhizosphaerae]|uniref:LPS A protein n=1 Tax=Salinicola rhizosphaerae TaxID=1443141 RepID=A0ABQ3DVB7_9GAMM|nr:glycosyl transferase family 90 [Salinicola rhizosphaerae]GHB14451.1 LPS A protein [Salinicola rhizosphaerae]
MDVRFKSRKLRFYATGLASLLVPDALFRQRLERMLAECSRGLSSAQTEAIWDRVYYYNRLRRPFELGAEAVRIGDFRYEKRGAYYLDAKRVVRHFDPDLRFAYRFGDVTWICETPSIVKSRPICREAVGSEVSGGETPGNANNLLLKLNSVRHFQFARDRLAFRDKLPGIVWRGKCFHEHRAAVLRTYRDHPRMNIGQSHAKRRHQRDYRPYLSIAEQLRYQFVLSLEGKDVATNLKWILSSNSLCFMPPPRFETWFMEGRLEPYVHYVPLAEDCSDMEEKMDHYLANPAEAEAIVRRANAHVRQFLDPRIETWVGLLTMHRYFKLSGQLAPASEDYSALLPVGSSSARAARKSWA